MSLWGIEKKPVWLTNEEKENCVSTNKGWVLSRKNGIKELLVAISNLDKRNGDVSLSSINFTAKKFITGNKLNVKFSFNEPITLPDEYKIDVQFGINEEIPATYDAHKTYKVGDKVTHSGSYYICKTEIKVGEEFNPEKWNSYQLESPTHATLPIARGNKTSTVTFEHNITSENKGEILIPVFTLSGFDLNGFDYSAYPGEQNSFPLKTGIYINK